MDFGDYLRALITADRDLVPDDERRYRISIIEAFRRRGIYPQGVRSLSAESLCWAGPDAEDMPKFQALLPQAGYLASLQPEWSLSSDRKDAWKATQKSAAQVHAWLSNLGRPLGPSLGLALEADAPLSIERGAQGLPKFEVHSVRPARRIAPDGDTRVDLVIELTQKRRAYLDPDLQTMVDEGKIDPPPPEDFWFRGGSTVLVNLERSEVRYCIGKGITSAERLERQRRFVAGDSDGSLAATYFGDPRVREEAEPFALLHRSL